jgi:hypothetical protein
MLVIEGLGEVHYLLAVELGKKSWRRALVLVEMPLYAFPRCADRGLG